MKFFRIIRGINGSIVDGRMLIEWTKNKLRVAWPAVSRLYLDVGLRVFEPCRSGSQSESELSKLSTSLSETSQQNGTNICVFPSICSSEKYVDKRGF